MAARDMPGPGRQGCAALGCTVESRLGIGGGGVADYRVYQVGLDGHFINFHAFACKDDVEAIARARWLIDGNDVELWSGERFVIKLECAQHRPAR
jgi:hypothetical protein